MTTTNALRLRSAPLHTPSDLGENAVSDISAALTRLLADTFVLYLKTKNFHWHMSGPHFRDYHLLLDDQGEQIFAITDDIAERCRKIGGTTLRSIGQIAREQRISDNDATYVTPHDMLAELAQDNSTFISLLRSVHAVCEEHDDVATTSLIEVWIDEAERRTWFLFEAGRTAD
ncbi:MULTISPECIES: Dps family protein [unclassified Mesorhizobium]|uniref:Dps family protein n=1 Tax=unclassified Mesorhizobium TaxID=325217 RepID=UPI001CCA1C9D|nr:MULTISPECIES: DNA starvation/stationary phase protection protein [unclassified Mesorhizobium]MBZ9742210.1 DNA starvation/stationary phase protection protein [Mesorhizobium sp. CO1-1-4]MBZ9774050.1 DNA starvation/stationary phase protection protein [Mesorhizobium sp. CO1-1-8]MBZ9805815.1 DNA starvation/stationary phase protection protein [Mesorhizobium sp. ES1-6]MBZ9996220.1 DNA starvation/stationary phase protection protein [Mesorhizobium sp. BH1-1-4]